MPESSTRVLQYGLGPIGRAAARHVALHPDTELVGAVDVDPGLVGRPVGELVGASEVTVPVREDATEALAERDPDVVLHTTTSHLPEVTGQIARCVRADAHVVSSTEELLFPFHRHPQLSEQIGDLARRFGVVVVGTGVNPGFVMDTLALTATGVCTEVEHVRARRVVDAGERRGPLQEKIGAGLSRSAFHQLRDEGRIGHVGLVESLRLLARGLKWNLTRVEESLEPRMAESDLSTDYVQVEAGQVVGIDHRATGYVEGTERLDLRLEMHLGAEDPRDAIRIDGTPPVDLEIDGGIFGDTATVGALTNAIPALGQVRPGLRTIDELPVPRAALRAVRTESVRSGE